MKIKIVLGILIIAVVLAGTLYFVIDRKTKPVFSDADIVLEQENGTGLPEEIARVIHIPNIADLMAEMETGLPVSEKEGLLFLAQENNALGYYANMILANRYDEKGKDASPFYRAALSLYSTKEVRFQFASHLIKSGETKAAQKEYLSLLPDEKAMEALHALYTDIENISESLVQKREWKAVVEWLTPFIEQGLAEKDLLRHYAEALAQQGEYKRAVPFLKALYDDDQTDSGLAWWYGRSLEATGQTAAASKVYTTLGESGAYRLGIILNSQGRTMEAAEAFNSSNQAISIWRAARIWDEAGMMDKALSAYTRLTENQSAYQDDAAYRAFILSGRLGKTDTEPLLEVLSAHPAWMIRVGRSPVMRELYEVTYEKPVFLEHVEAYEQAGYAEAARIELAIGTRNTGVEEKLAIGDWYQERGEYYRAVVWGIRSISDKPTRRGYELAYPKAFEEMVLAAAERYNVEAALIWAVMREESHFRHDVVSSAGAMGLMQIMPATGKDIASRLRTTIEEKDLLNPDISIRFGTFYIQSMLNMFGQDKDKAMAAYNGGPGNVNRWLQSGLGTTKADFPTAITFFETQEYITKVKNSYAIYEWLYDLGKPPY